MVINKDDIKLENLVVSIGIPRKLDLEELSKKLKDITYDPSNFPGIIYRLNEHRVTALIFSSGKIICTGLKDYNKIEIVSKEIIDNINQALGMDIKREECKITVNNIVATVNLNRQIDLSSLIFLFDNVEYEPEDFPGLILRDDSGITFLIFSTGKVVCTGAKSLEQLIERVNNLAKKLDENKKFSII